MTMRIKIMQLIFLGLAVAWLAGCASSQRQPPPFAVSLDKVGPVWLQDVSFAMSDTGPVIRGYFYQNWDPGGTVRFPGHIDLEIVDHDGRSSVWKVRVVTVSRQLRYIRHGMFEAESPSCVPEGSRIVVHYALHADGHPPIASCDA